MEGNYFICIDGPIGVGKTYIYKILVDLLREKYGDRLFLIPEYIDGDQAETAHYLLQEYLSGNLTNDVFQSWIQNYYIRMLTEVSKYTGKIVLMERCMSDSVAIFSNIANLKDNDHRNPNALTDFKFLLLYEDCIRVDEVAGAPNYFKKNGKLKRIETTDEKQTIPEIMKLIEDDLLQGNQRRIIGLYNTPEVCFERCRQRSRKGEDSYTFESIKGFCDMYERLYELIEDQRYPVIRFPELGYITKDSTRSDDKKE